MPTPSVPQTSVDRDCDEPSRSASALDALIDVFHERELALQLVAKAGFPVSLIPPFSTPMAFWTKVVREARSGALCGGLRPLIEAAADMYPHNPAFGGPAAATTPPPRRPPPPSIAQSNVPPLRTLADPLPPRLVSAASTTPTRSSLARITVFVITALGIATVMMWSPQELRPDPLPTATAFAPATDRGEAPEELVTVRPLTREPQPHGPFDGDALERLSKRPLSRDTLRRIGGEGLAKQLDDDLPTLVELLGTRPWLLDGSQDSGTISGRVIDAERRPVLDAIVCTWTFDSRVPARVRRNIRCARTIHRGRFEIERVIPGYYDVFAFAPKHLPSGFVQHHEYPLVVPPRTHRRGVDLTLSPGGVEVRGTIKDTNGVPIEHAMVTTMEPPRSIGMVGNDGEFSLWVADPEARLFAWADGYADLVTEQHAPEGPSPFHALVLPRESVLQGEVVDEATKLVANAQVYARAADDGLTRIAHSKADGSFEFIALAAGRYDVSAQTHNGRSRASIVSLRTGMVAEALRLRLEREDERDTIDEVPPSQAEETEHDASTRSRGVTDAVRPPPPPPPPRVSLARRLKRCGRDGTIRVKADFLLADGTLTDWTVSVDGNAASDPKVEACARKTVEAFEWHASRRRKSGESFRDLVVRLKKP